jgi:hypothetical protein
VREQIAKMKLAVLEIMSLHILHRLQLKLKSCKLMIGVKCFYIRAEKKNKLIVIEKDTNQIQELQNINSNDRVIILKF